MNRAFKNESKQKQDGTLLFPLALPLFGVVCFGVERQNRKGLIARRGKEGLEMCLEDVDFIVALGSGE